MEEKIYKTMGSTGAASLAVGICVDFGLQLLEAVRAQRMRRMESSFVNHKLPEYPFGFLRLVRGGVGTILHIIEVLARIMVLVRCGMWLETEEVGPLQDALGHVDAGLVLRCRTQGTRAR